MIRMAISILGLIVACSAAGQEYRPLASQYMIYSGSIGDPAPATKGDAKASIVISGKAAEDIFNQIGPDIRDSCNADGGSRFRAKAQGAIACQYAKSDGYVCYFGVDLKKGKLVNASVC